MTASHLGRPRRLRYHDLAREGVRHLTLRVILHTYPKRAILGGSLMMMQSFPYNAIFFSYALVLAKFYHVNSNMAPLCGLEPLLGKAPDAVRTELGYLRRGEQFIPPALDALQSWAAST